MIRSAVLLALFGAALSLACGGSLASAQQRDAFVAPRGMVRIEAAGIFSAFDDRFVAGGETEPLASDLGFPLDAERFEPVASLRSDLIGFFEATAEGFGGDPLDVPRGALTAGTPDFSAAANTRVVPMRLGVGVLPRVEVFVEAPLLRADVLAQRFGLADANLGLNPDTAQNREAVGTVSPEWAELGGSALLPLQDTPLGDELSRRVPGILLPEESLAAQALAALLEGAGAPGFTSRNEDWRIGDVQFGARVQLLGGTGERFFPPAAAGVRLRSTATASVRLPTGTVPNPNVLIDVSPQAGMSGFGIGVDTDLFVGRRVWATGSVHYAGLGEVDAARRVTAPDAPLLPLVAVREVRWDPADVLEIDLHPRVRVADVIAIGVNYRALLVGESRFTASGEGAIDPSVLDSDAATVQQLGATLRYSTFPARTAGSTVLPLDVQISYRTTLSGVDRSPARSSVIVQGSIYWSAF